MRGKPEIDRQVAAMTGAPLALVSQITRLFLENVSNSLVDDREVQLSGFGRFRLTERRGVRSPKLTLVDGSQVEAEHPLQLVVTFSKSAPLRARINKRYGKGAERGEVRS